MWTNLKAILAGAGQYGKYYRDFVPFTPEEIRQHFALYILHGLSPPPQIEIKFHTQEQDKLNGNDFTANTLSSNPCTTTRRHKMFKAFLALQDPRTITPPQDKYPNWKV